MKKHYFFRYVSITLILVLLVNVLPMQSVNATGISESAGEYSAQEYGNDETYLSRNKTVNVLGNEAIGMTDNVSASQSEAAVLYEVENLREESTKHFKLSDGSFMAVAYGMPVHYRDADGKWQDIDNSLVLRTDSTGTAAYQSGTENTSVTFSTTLEKGELFTAVYGDASVSMSLLDTIQAVRISTDMSTAQGEAEVNETTAKQIDTGFMENAAVDLSDAPAYSRSAKASIEAQKPSVLPSQNSRKFRIEDVIPEKLQSSLSYKDVFPGVDLMYTTYGYNIKEQIVINEPQASYRYDFLLKMDGLTAELNTDGSIFLKDAKGMVVYKIPMPYMEDSAGQMSMEVFYSLQETAQGTILTMEADKEWINSEDRTYPVKIDPTLIQQPTNLNEYLNSTYVKEGAPDTVFGYNFYNFLGTEYYHEETCIERIFMHFAELPIIPEGCEVVDARINVYKYYYEYSGKDFRQFPIGLYEVTGNKPAAYSTYRDWFLAMTWNNQPAYDTSNVIDYAIARYNEEHYMEWDISELVKKWYTENTENTTIALVAMNEADMTEEEYALAGFSIDEYVYPVFAVSYRNTVGIEPYYTYATMDAGNAGMGYITDHTGQLKVVREIASYASTINPFSLNLVYNSDYFSSSTGDYQPAERLGLSMMMGSGWTLDVLQSVTAETIEGSEYLRYHDGDGTVHYFLKDNDDGLYYDEDGLGLIFKKVNGQTYEMTDKEDNLWIFTDGILTTIMDNNRTKTGDTLAQDGNRYVLDYTSDKKLNTIRQQNKGGTAITVATFAYNTSGYLTSITDAAGLVTYLGYTGSDLTSITRQSNTMASYTYSGHRVTCMEDVRNSYAMNFVYTNGKVSSYYETGNDVRGAECHISYPNASKTVYQDYGMDRNAGEDDIYTYCLFDYAGRTVNMYTTDIQLSATGELTAGVLSASNAVYLTQNTADSTNADASTIFQKNNRISRSSTLGVASQQLIADFGFENGLSNTEWTLEGVTAEGNYTDITIVGENPRTGNYSLKGVIPNNNSVTIGVGARRQTKILKAGETYTFSAYVNTSQVVQMKGNGVYLEVLYGNTTLAKSNYVNYITSTEVNDGWTRLSVTFTAVADASHTVRIYNDRAEGVFFADDLQLEKGEAPSNVNLLVNGDMSTAGQGWTLWSTGAYSMGAIRVSGSPLLDNCKFYQDVPINLLGTESFILSGWVRANAVPNNENTEDSEDDEAYAKGTTKQCGLRAIIHYSDDTEEYHYVAFDADVADWQFASVAVVPKQPTKTVEYIRVMGTYEKNANIAYFDNLSLVREVAQTYTYDGEGNLVSVTATGLKEDTNTYQNGNLIQTVTGGQGTYVYDYDETYTRRLTKVTVGEAGISQNYGYDSRGNITSTTLEGTGGTGKLQTVATYSADGNRLASVTDSSGNTTVYTYGDIRNQTFGTPSIITDGNGNQVRSSYNIFNQIEESGVYDGVGNSFTKVGGVRYVYTGDRLADIKRSSSGTAEQIYHFVYNNFGNATSVKVGSKTLAGYTYGAKNGLIQTLTYGNGDAVSYAYDKYGRVKTETHDTGTLTYTYNGEGLLYNVSENNTNAGNVSRYLYTYDNLSRLLYSERLNNGSLSHRISNVYNDRNQLVGQNIQLDDMSYKQSYIYTEGEGSLEERTLDLDGTNGVDYTVNLSYDHLKRLSGVSNDLFSYSYTYHDVDQSSGLTTNQVQGIWYSQELGSNWSFQYEYDGVGNITTYQEPDGTTTYEYDAMSQLTKATKGSTIYTYTYDSGGNILTASGGGTSHTYTYGDSDWKDLLTAYDGHGITYDGVGNPVTYYNGTEWEFVWTDGRKLTEAESTNGTRVTYLYDVDGTRRSKTVDGVTHTYIWEDGRPLKEYVSGNTDIYIAGETMYFFYDQDGRPFLLRYNNANYYYILNLQGDVVRLVSDTGENMATYEYDPYGNIISAAGEMAEVNPLRYRGYYYDAETGLYYVSSRYYDPAIGRFINADAAIGQIGNVQGTNMFAYCFNNPVNMSDPTGNWPKLSTIFTVVAVAAVAVAAVAVTVATCGAAAPALAVAGGGIIGGISAGAAATAASVATGAMIVAGVSTAAAVTSAVAEKAVEKTAKQNNSVYVLKDDTGTVQYVGRTTDVAKRAKAHEANPARAGLKLEVIQPNLNYLQARAVEQAAMAYYHTINTANKMNNQINGISTLNPKLGIYKEAAVGMLGYTWNQVSNEILYWTGN